MNILILYSGGLDSLIMKRYAEVMYPDATVTCVFYDIGQAYAAKERAALPDYVIQRELPWLGHDFEGQSKEGSDSVSGNIFIPGRNMLLATAAACMYLPDEIWMGALLGETHGESTDKNYTFLEKINDTLRYVLSPFKRSIRFPLADEGLNKLTATKWALDNGVTEAQIKHSSSCLSGEAGNCGKCVVCLRRWGIFRQLGIAQEQYNVDPVETKELRDMVTAMTCGDHYDEHRLSEIIPALPDGYLDKGKADMEFADD
jgi:7-cyano-7-deazaguanine synthase in queuosine biosynthesis